MTPYLLRRVCEAAVGQHRLRHDGDGRAVLRQRAVDQAAVVGDAAACKSCCGLCVFVCGGKALRCVARVT